MQCNKEKQIERMLPLYCSKVQSLIGRLFDEKFLTFLLQFIAKLFIEQVYCIEIL